MRRWPEWLEWPEWPEVAGLARGMGIGMGEVALALRADALAEWLHSNIGAAHVRLPSIQRNDEHGHADRAADGPQFDVDQRVVVSAGLLGVEHLGLRPRGQAVEGRVLHLPCVFHQIRGVDGHAVLIAEN